MKARVSIPVTVKCRLGVDDQDPDAALNALAESVIAAGADALIVHARKAWLKGLSPRENRDVPPLDYGLVHALKQRFPEVPVILNGGLVRLDQMQEQLHYLDGVMVGRAAYQDPALLLEVDRLLFGAAPAAEDAFAAIELFMPYVEQRLTEGVPLHAMTRHILGLFNGRKGARAWRRHLATEGVKPGADAHVLREALAYVRRGSEQHVTEAAA
jgi:tRNA-dihydrouridine synthase A